MRDHQGWGLGNKTADMCVPQRTCKPITMYKCARALTRWDQTGISRAASPCSPGAASGWRRGARTRRAAAASAPPPSAAPPPHRDAHVHPRHCSGQGLHGKANHLHRGIPGHARRRKLPPHFCSAWLGSSGLCCCWKAIAPACGNEHYPGAARLSLLAQSRFEVAVFCRVMITTRRQMQVRGLPKKRSRRSRQGSTQDRAD